MGQARLCQLEARQSHLPRALAVLLELASATESSFRVDPSLAPPQGPPECQQSEGALSSEALLLTRRFRRCGCLACGSGPRDHSLAIPALAVGPR